MFTVLRRVVYCDVYCTGACNVRNVYCTVTRTVLVHKMYCDVYYIGACTVLVCVLYCYVYCTVHVVSVLWHILNWYVLALVVLVNDVTT